MPEVVVAFTVSGQREKYLRRALDSWLRVRGAQDACFVFCVEPAPAFPVADFTRWVHGQFTDCGVRVNPRVLGIVENSREAFDAAFALGARLAVLAEEDLAVSADVLEYLRWAMAEYESAPEVTMVCAHARESQGRDAAAVVRASWFNPLVCATWRDRWEEFLRPAWGPWRPGAPGNSAWDSNLRQVMHAAGTFSIFPARSRVLHIGEISTTYGLALSEFMYKDSVSACFAPDYPPCQFREVGFADVPGLRI